MKENFGQFIKELRKKCSLTQKDLAEKLHVSDKAVSKWEVGDSYPDISLLLPIAEVFEISVDELLNCETSKQEAKNENTKKLVVFNIASNLVLIVVLVVFLLLTLIQTGEGSSIALTVVDIKEYTITSLLTVLVLSIIFGTYNFLLYKRIGRGERSEEVNSD